MSWESCRKNSKRVAVGDHLINPTGPATGLRFLARIELGGQIFPALVGVGPTRETDDLVFGILQDR